MKKALGVFCNAYTSSLLARATREFFSDLPSENLVESLEVKAKKMYEVL